MAEPRTKREYTGSAAVDLRLEELPQLPEEKQKLQRVRRVKARASVSPFSVLGILAVLFFGAMVIFGYVRLYQADSNLSKLQTQLTTLQSDQSKLKTKYESQMNLSNIEQQAEALGMRQPKSSQTVYVSLSGVDRAEITPVTHSNPVTTVFQALRDSVTGFLEYLF